MAKGKLTPEEFLVLHRHWIWSDMLRLNFDAELKKKTPITPIGCDHRSGYMCLWYGTLYTVIEVIEEKKLVVAGLKPKDPLYGALKLFRNAIFHVQEEYWSPKLLEIMQDPDSALKIRAIHSALGDYFLSELKKSHPTLPIK